ncbi:MAG TPA: TasA family protein [Symbiobacteriaceae bacterium]|nr:TasA family protein [Symbiobacteriaceae bacterium]
MLLKRAAKVMLLIGAAGLLMAAGGTLALFFANTPVQTNQLATGSVTLGAPATTMINVANLVPGASDETTYTVTYTGSAPAWLGVVANVSGDLTTCDGGKLQMLLADDGNPAITYRWNQPLPEVVRTGGTPVAPVAAPVSTGTSKTFRVGYTLPLDAANDCQNRTGTIELQVVAIQAQFNTNGTNNGPTTWGTVAPLVLDQSNTTGTVAANGIPVGDFGEVFTAGRSGALEKVRIALYGAPLTDVTVSIRTVSGGLPGGTVLASATIPKGNLPAALSSPPVLVDAIFPTPATVTAGTQYAYTVSIQSGLHTAVSGDQYAGGYWVFDGGGWQQFAGFDMFFETYVR